MTYEFIKLHVNEQGVARLTLNRADKHNAFNETVIAEITTALTEIQSLKNVRVLLLQAEGKSFSAGADLDWMRRMADYSYEENVEDASGLATMLNTLYKLSIPTIAQVQGSAYGGGVGLVACCDIAIASDKAEFCLSEVKLGLIPATISPYVVKAMGERVCTRLFISAEKYSAQQAKQWNLISEVVGHDQLTSKVNDWIKTLLNNSPDAIISSKQLVRSVVGRAIDQNVINETSRGIAEARTSNQGREGVKAFLEKRKPVWN